MECYETFHPERFHVPANASSVPIVSLQSPTAGFGRCACLQCGDGLPSLRHLPQHLLQIPPASRAGGVSHPLIARPMSTALPNLNLSLMPCCVPRPNTRASASSD